MLAKFDPDAWTRPPFHLRVILQVGFYVCGTSRRLSPFTPCPASYSLYMCPTHTLAAVMLIASLYARGSRLRKVEEQKQLLLKETEAAKARSQAAEVSCPPPKISAIIEWSINQSGIKTRNQATHPLREKLSSAPPPPPPRQSRTGQTLPGGHITGKQGRSNWLSEIAVVLSPSPGDMLSFHCQGARIYKS